MGPHVLSLTLSRLKECLKIEDGTACVESDSFASKRVSKNWSSLVRRCLPKSLRVTHACPCSLSARAA